jgi:glycosyltransferase involved in cell wall biosynthesis
MDDFVAELNGDPELKQSLLHLSGIDDAALSKLYADAGFCVYPPKFEGFGLPPIEALAAGKALIVSNAGPIPEVVGDFALCLDPDDLEAWTTHLRDWINGSPERERYARRARENYRPLGWDESARMFFDAAMSRD